MPAPPDGHGSRLVARDRLSPRCHSRGHLRRTCMVGGRLRAVWLPGAAIWRPSSLAALLAFGSLPLWVWLPHPPASMALFAIGTTGLIAYRHRDNIPRLLTGTEAQIGER